MSKRKHIDWSKVDLVNRGERELAAELGVGKTTIQRARKRAGLQLGRGLKAPSARGRLAMLEEIRIDRDLYRAHAVRGRQPRYDAHVREMKNRESHRRANARHYRTDRFKARRQRYKESGKLKEMNNRYLAGPAAAAWKQARVDEKRRIVNELKHAYPVDAHE